MASEIHPTAQVDSHAQIGDGVRIGPNVVIEPDVVIGADCEIMAGAVIRRFTTMGAGNIVHPFAVLGGEPQDLKFDRDNETYLRIGSGNSFREYVTLNRATTTGGSTVIGDNCYFMTQSHVGHDCIIADGVTFTNAAAAAGHVEIGPGAFLSANVGVHQFCWVGELVMVRGQAGITQHVPPFVILKEFNHVAGLNSVGLRRCEQIGAEDIQQIKDAYRLLYRSSLTPEQALTEMDARSDWGGPAGRFRDFVRRVLSAEGRFQRGLVTGRAQQRI